MKQITIVNVSLGLALGALLVMFTPFMSDFSSLHIGGELLGLGAFVVGLLCFAAITPTRNAVLALTFVLVIGSLIEAAVIALPAITNLVPNPVSYINFAEQQMFLGCTLAGPFLLAGGVFGGLMRAWVQRRR
jgi:hypothetical protein